MESARDTLQLFRMKVQKNRNTLIWIFSTYLFFAVMQLTTWLPMRFWAAWGGGNFLDTWQVLKYADCYKLIHNDVYLSQGSCPGYLYGRPLLQFLNYFEIGESDTKLVGFILMLIVAIIFGWLQKVTDDKSNSYLLALVIVSPPVMLLVERGNVDILIASLVILACIAFTKDFKYLAYILISVTIIFKFYTAPVLVIFLLLDRKYRTRAVGAVLLIFSTYSAVHDIRITQTPYPSGALAQFGGSVWGKYLDLTDRTWFASTIPLAIDVAFLLAAIITVAIIKKLSHQDLFERNFTAVPGIQILFLAISSIHIACFFLGTSFDYRLIYLTIATLLGSKLGVLSPVAVKALLINMLFCLYLSYPSGGLQPIGDFLVEMQTGFLALVSLKILVNTFKR
jgi:hypothetical protein